MPAWMNLRLPLGVLGAVGSATTALSHGTLSVDFGAAPFFRPASASSARASSISVTPVVGGHAGMLTDHSQGQVMKPLAGSRGHAEAAFYKQAFAGRRRELAPAKFMPAFFGISTREDDSPSSSSHAKSYLVLEDLTAPYARPSVMDVKMGVQTWDEDASPAKVAQERTKWPPQQVVGFRVTGMRVWDASERRYKEHGRQFGYRLDEATLGRAFLEFLHDGARVRVEAIPPLLARLREILHWLEGQSDHRFYGSSLLLIYEGDGARAGGASPRVDVRMIDFAHVWPIRDAPPGSGRDNGYLLGLRNVIAYLEDVHAEHAPALLSSGSDRDAAAVGGLLSPRPAARGAGAPLQ